MVDVSDKAVTARTAVATGVFRTTEAVIAAIADGVVPKGDVLATARAFEDYLDPDDPAAGTEIVHVLLDTAAVPYGEVRVAYADGRVDELTIDGLVR